jgi:hypothetical protein
LFVYPQIQFLFNFVPPDLLVYDSSYRYSISEERMPRKLLHGRLERSRRCERPRKRSLHSLEEELRFMWVRRWWEKVGCREEWGIVVREAKAHPGL